MLCSQCKKRPATVHFESLINGKSTHYDVCQECSRQLNLDIESLMSFPIVPPAFSELLDLLSELKIKPAGTSRTRAACPTCKWTLAQFQKTGRMGCPECYTAFETEARTVLKKFHGPTTHKGKKSPRESLPELKRQLEKAVKSENYELAAELRDKIKKHEI